MANKQTTTSEPKGTLTVKLVRSIAGTRESHRATVRGLGLRKLNSEFTLEDTPAVRGMINKVSYLVKVL
ncbi:50S ribosomal protein L30 [Rhizobacter sp. Root404]|jgi:large subunit ribosomal protein L30|uniref:50S ribosomal protein L30 n=1 Tax=Rhizobacter sp. Root404 TaxID=1736528 RepID=UPI0006F2CB94|nr:50S ribosomal protein L30 [Rhizobacter sp. Root404]KQW33488.1 50S ribosomal protein L30 [Rhizobacter sp. Root404]